MKLFALKGKVQLAFQICALRILAVPIAAIPNHHGAAADLASHILDKKASQFDPHKFKDKYEAALKALVKRKAAGKTIEVPEKKEEESNVIDLMDALNQSLGRKKAAARRSKGKKGASARRNRKRKAA